MKKNPLQPPPPPPQNPPPPPPPPPPPLTTEPTTTYHRHPHEHTSTLTAKTEGAITSQERAEGENEPSPQPKCFLFTSTINVLTQYWEFEGKLCLNDLSYIPLNNEQNEPTQGDIGETSNELTQAIRNEFEELYAIANEELYLGYD
ncbi:hypothetical protein Tco_0637487 [Tanacetum coccineum]